MPRCAWPLAVFVVLAAACGGDAESVPFRFTAVLTRLVAPEDSAVAGVLAQIPNPADPEITQLENLNANFALFAACPRSVSPILFDASGTRVGASGRGQLRVTLAEDADAGTTDHCAGEGRFRLLPGTLDPGGEALSRAPVVLEGPTLVARLDLSSILQVQDLPFDDWVELSGRLSGDPPELDDGQLLPSWSAATMHARLTEVGIDYLDVFVYYGAQPDVDRDGDGLEQLFDTDGNGFVDECRDGDGTEIVGTDCPADPRIADAFALELDYSTAAAEIVGVAEL